MSMKKTTEKTTDEAATKRGRAAKAKPASKPVARALRLRKAAGVDLFTYQETCDMLAIKLYTLRKYRRQGYLKSTRILGKYYITGASIREFVEKNAVENDAAAHSD